MKTKIHNWNTVNRDVHQPEDLTIADVVEEVRAALMCLPEDAFLFFVKAIDEKRYHTAGAYFEDALSRLNDDK